MTSRMAILNTYSRDRRYTNSSGGNSTQVDYIVCGRQHRHERNIKIRKAARDALRETSGKSKTAKRRGGGTKRSRKAKTAAYQDLRMSLDIKDELLKAA